MSYFEHPDYVPLLRQTYTLWDQLGETCGTEFLHKVGLLYFVHPERSRIATGLIESSERYRLRLDHLDAAAVRHQFPHFTQPQELDVYFEPDAGYVEVEPALSAMANLAQQAGATLYENEPVSAWQAKAKTIRITTSERELETEKLILCPGAWGLSLIPGLGANLRVLRRVLFWHPAGDRFTKSPCFFYEMPEGFFYGFPKVDSDGIKIGAHFLFDQDDPVVSDPSQLDRSIHDRDRRPIEKFISTCLPNVSPQATRASTCMYTMTPDEHFILDQHPLYDNVLIAAGFSGHGFKFAPVVGDIMTDLVLKREPSVPMRLFSLKRFSIGSGL